MGQIQSPLWVLLDAEVNRLDALRSRRVVVGIALELEASSPESPLRLEDAGVADCHLEGLVLVAVEASILTTWVRELDDLTPLLTALDVVGVED